MQLPLTKIKVLDLSRLIPGPYCSMMLADLGAEVLKVEEPQRGDYMRWIEPLVKGQSIYFTALNRNKKSLTLNLKSAKGKEIFLNLVNDYDVVLESFRPGVVNRLGIGYEIVSKVNPKIIFCSISGYGQDGPCRDRSGHDLDFMALSGMLNMISSPNGKPPLPEVQLDDFVTGYAATAAILAALVRRSSTGDGDYIDISMLDSLYPIMTLPIADFFASGGKSSRGNTQLTGLLNSYGIYQTKDGKYMALAALEKKFWKNFCEVIGKKDWIDKHSATGGDRKSVRHELENVFRSKTQQEWIELLKDKDTCCEPVNDLSNSISLSQVVSREMITEIESDKFGTIKTVGSPFKFSKVSEKRTESPPGLGEHTQEVLCGLGYDNHEIEKLRKHGIC